MNYLRSALLLGSFCGAVALLVLAKTLSRSMTQEEIIVVLVGAGFLALVFFYVLQMPTPKPRTRLGRMWRYWLDAKEKELASRANSRDTGSSA